MTDKVDLPPGPAFILVLKEELECCFCKGHDITALAKGWVLCKNCAAQTLVNANVPKGYIWQPATEGTGAGWVRPRGGVK